MRGTTVLGVVLAMFAMLLTPVAAQAAPGDLAHGVVRVDANKDNAITSAALGEDDRGLAGVTVNALDAAGNVVATTTTAADGSWSIKEADVIGDPAVRIEIVTDSANGDVYATHASATADNDFVRSTAPNKAHADLPGPDAELNALVYPIWSFDLALMSGAGLGGKQVFTGTDPWDGDDNVGNDSSASNDRVRSADIVAFNWSITADNEEGMLADKFTDAVFEQTIELGDGAVANFVRIPAACDVAKSSIRAYGGPNNPAAGTVVVAPNDPPAGTTSVVLTCNLGSMGDHRNAILPFPTSIQPSSSSANGSDFTTSARVYGVDANGAATARPYEGEEVGPIEITSVPRYDVEKFTNNGLYTGTYNVPGVGPTFGYWTYHTIQISTDRKVGVEAFQQPVTVEESFWGNRSVTGPNGETVGSNIGDLKWYIDLCDVSPNSGQLAARTVYGRPNANVGGGSNASNSVRDSGTCSYERTGAADTGNYTLSFNNIDVSGATYPTQTAGGQSLAAGPYYVASYRLRVFIPASEIDRTQGAADDGAGELAVFNRIGGFDPDGVSGTSNFGDGFEPGYCEPGPTSDQSTNCDPMEDDTTSNNVDGPITVRMSPGSWAKYIVDATSGWVGGYTGIPEVVTTTHTGTGQVQPGQTFTSTQHLNNNGVDMTSAQMCDVFDNTVLKLSPLNQDVSASSPFPDDLYSAVIRIRDGTTGGAAVQEARQGDWITKYGTIDLSGDDPNTGVFDLSQNRYEGNWTEQRAATDGANTVCGSDTITWSDAPTADTNVVWTYTAPGYVVKSGDQERWFLAFEQRDAYHGGPHAGEQIPAGTIAANYGNVKTSTLAPNWTAAAYVPGSGYTQPFSANTDRQPGESGSAQGDRWTVSRALMRLQKQTVAVDVLGTPSTGVAAFGITGGAVAGKPVVWEIVSTLTATSDEPAPVNNVVITDTLPKYVTYNEAATQAIEGGTPASSYTVNDDGTTTLVWNLGQRTPNQDLPVLRIATDTDPMAPNNATAINRAAITADGIVPVSAHRDDHTIVLEQTGELQMKKSVDRTLDLQDDDQQYTLQLKNFSDTSTVTNPTIIDVLPYNDDATNAAGVNRSPQSDYAGTNRLNSAPQAFEFDGTTPLAGTFYYTTTPGADVPQHLSDDVPAIWSTTFTANATAFKFVAAQPLATSRDASKSGILIKFQTDQDGNDPGDIYTNRFTAFTPDAVNQGRYQLLTSNTVTVRVVGFSLGDLIWFDLNRNGKYDAGTDRLAPEGVTVQVRNAAGTVVATTATLGGDQQGRWVVNNLAAGDYYVTIPASEFGSTGLLAGAIPSVNPVLDPNTDANEGEDHHAIADGAGVRSAGVITLSADTEADPLTGEEPLGDNVAGMTLAPLTTDDFTNLTLDLALIPAVGFTVEKVVDGPAASYGVGPFQIIVECTVGDPATDAPGYPKTLTFNGAGEQTLTAPLGSRCTASETGTGNATSVAIAPRDGITLDDEDGEFALTATNTFEVGSLKIAKRVEGAGAGIAQTGRTYTFTVACVFNGRDVPVQTVTLTDDGSGTLTSEEITGLPVGATCTITETSAGGADTTPQPLQVVIDSDPETVQEVGPFVNEFSAGTLDLAKALDGDAKDDAFLLDQQYTLDLVCQVAEGVDYFRGSVTLKPGAAQPVTVGDAPLLLPVGARCWIDGESVDQGAKAASFNFDGYDNAAIVVAQEDSAQTQTLELSAVNTFDQATLTVSKKVVGPGTGKAYDFELACTYPVQGENGVEDIEYPLADGDAKFSLKDGQTKTVTVPAGVSCKVVETNVPDGATVTIEDSDGTTEGGVTDGEVTELEGTENFVQVTNTFPNPPLKNTGGELPVGALWAGAGLLVAGAALLLARRSRRDRAILGDRDSGGDI